MKPIRLLNLGRIPAGHTQAVYHALADRMDDSQPDTLVLCQPAQAYLCLGYHQILESVFEPAECARRGLPIYRRQIGGGATYLDENQIFYQCVFHHSHMPAMVNDIFAYALAAPVMVLRQFGLQAALRKTNEIEIDAKRIAGTGGGRIGDAAVVVGNLLLDFDFEAMAAVWRAPTAGFRLLAQKALRESLVTLRDLSVPASIDTITERLIAAFGQTTGRQLEVGELTSEEVEAVQQKTAELASDDYLSLHSPAHNVASPPAPMKTLKISARAQIINDTAVIDGYEIEGSFWLDDQNIREVILEAGPGLPSIEVESALIGAPFDQWKDRLTVLMHRPASALSKPLETLPKKPGRA